MRQRQQAESGRRRTDGQKGAGREQEICIRSREEKTAGGEKGRKHLPSIQDCGRVDL